MAGRVDLAEYLRNVRELLKLDRNKFGLMVDRQVQFKVLPGLNGQRAALEPQLWELLVLCLDGPEAPVPSLDEALVTKALGAAETKAGLSTGVAAAFPAAALAVAQTLRLLRDVGVYPPPKGRPS